MKKITKIGLLSLALATCMTVLNVNAGQTGDTRQVTLSLTAGSNSCTIEDYEFGSFQVSVDDRAIGPKTGNVVCSFLENATGYINIQLADLVATEGTITRDHFEFSVDSADSTGLIADLGTTARGAFPRDIYTKEANKLGSWSTIMTIWGTIPGGTPAGTYQGNLDLVIQATAQP